MTLSASDRASVGYPLALMMIVLAIGTALGVLKAYVQAWLPESLGSLANSSGTWCLVAVLLALLATIQMMAALFGALTLGALLVGYVLGSALRSNHSSTGFIAFWLLAAIVIGPLLGIAAYRVRPKGQG
jgi:hypothetical protein